MNLRKLPPSMLLVLGLAPEGCVGPCLSLGSFDDTVQPPINGTSTTTGINTSDVGPCLSPEDGPCLSPDLGSFDSTGSSTDSGSDSGSSGTWGSSSGSDSGSSSTGDGSGSDSSSGSDSGSGTGEASTGPCLAPPGIAPDDTPEEVATAPSPGLPPDSRRDALQRLLDRQALPADVASRLRSTLDD